MKSSSRTLPTLLRYTLTLSLAGIFCIMVVRQFSWAAFVDTWRNVHPGLLAACFALGGITTLLRALRFNLFFPYPGSNFLLYGCFASLRLLSVALPFRSGELVFLGLLKKLRMTPTVSEVLPVWIFLRAADLLTVAVLLMIPLSVLSLADHITETHWLPVLMLIGILGLIGASALLVHFPARFLPDTLAAALESARRGLARLTGIHFWITSPLMTLLLWCSMGCLIVLAFLALGIDLPVEKSFAVAFSLLAFSMLPIHTPMGIGTADAGLVFLFHLAGVSQADAVVFAVSVRIILISIVLVDGLIGSLLLSRHNPTDLEQSEEIP